MHHDCHVFNVFFLKSDFYTFFDYLYRAGRIARSAAMFFHLVFDFFFISMHVFGYLYRAGLVAEQPEVPAGHRPRRLPPRSGVRTCHVRPACH